MNKKNKKTEKLMEYFYNEIKKMDLFYISFFGYTCIT